MAGAEGGLGSALVGEKITMGQSQFQVTKLLGEGENEGKGIGRHVDVVDGRFFLT